MTDSCVIAVTIRTPEHFSRKFKKQREYLLFKQDYYDWCDRYMIGNRTFISWRVAFEDVEVITPDIICYSDVVLLLDNYMDKYGTKVLPKSLFKMSSLISHLHLHWTQAINGFGSVKMISNVWLYFVLATRHLIMQLKCFMNEIHDDYWLRCNNSADCQYPWFTTWQTKIAQEMSQ